MNAWMLKSLRQDGVVFAYNLCDSVKSCLGVSGQPRSANAVVIGVDYLIQGGHEEKVCTCSLSTTSLLFSVHGSLIPQPVVSAQRCGYTQSRGYVSCSFSVVSLIASAGKTHLLRLGL